MKKKFLAVFLTTIMTLSIAACGGGEKEIQANNDPPQESQEQKEIEL